MILSFKNRMTAAQLQEPVTLTEGGTTIPPPWGPGAGVGGVRLRTDF